MPHPFVTLFVLTLSLVALFVVPHLVVTHCWKLRFPRSVFVGVLVGGLFVAGGPAALAAATPCYLPPTSAPVAEPYRAPSCRYCRGHRAIDFATPIGAPLRAVAAGTITFSGMVAGVLYVVIDQGDGLRATYGGLGSVAQGVGTGASIGAGTVVGFAAGTTLFGLRRGDQYLDPTPLLGVLRYRARLVPPPGQPRPSGGPARLVCTNPASGR
ncbi:MAG: M23 family metallopeptidase [Synechococcus sp. ELA619]